MRERMHESEHRGDALPSHPTRDPKCKSPPSQRNSAPPPSHARSESRLYRKEVHNVTRDQLLALAAHIRRLCTAGDPHQLLLRQGIRGKDWLEAHAQPHELREIWRYGQEANT